MGMTPYVQDTDFTLYQGDALEVLAELPSGSVNCVVTSPPYWGLRDYGTGAWGGGDPDCDHLTAEPDRTHDLGRNRAASDGTFHGGPAGQKQRQYGDMCGKCGATRVDQQLGLEQTPDQYVTRMVQVFREIRRVLREDGTCWLNLGDSYAGGGGHTAQGETSQRAGRSNIAEQNRGSYSSVVAGLKPKDLVGIPWRVAFALQADGWYLRSDIIWAKPNPMPESVTDRPTKSHEYVFLLTKSARYFFDQEAVREPAEWARWGDQTTPKHAGTDTGSGWIQPRSKADLTPRNDGDRWNEHNGRGFTPNHAGRNIRSVWDIATQPYAEAHFATFPLELPRRCIKAGCPEWVCGTCGKARERIVETNNPSKQAADPDNTLGWANTHSKTSNAQSSKSMHRQPGGVYSTAVTTGWSDCGHDNYQPGVVLDPFLGAGTTALVARNLGRRSIGIELNPSYCELAAQRLAQQSLLAEGAA